MAPEKAHEVINQLRPQKDEEMLDLIRETVAQLNKLGDRLESYIKESGDDAIDSSKQTESNQSI